MFPEDARLAQCSVLTCGNEEVQRVVIRPINAKPMLDTWTDRKIIKRKVLMSADQHLHPGQAKHVFAAAVGQATGTLGQSHAGKYKPARKPRTIYTEDEVRQNVRQWRVNKGADGGTPKADLQSMLDTRHYRRR